MPRAPRRLAPLVLAIAFVLPAGCTTTTAPCPTSTVTVVATVTDDGMDPSGISVCRGQEVTMEVHSQTDAVLHLHGFDDQVPATSLTPGQVTTLQFTANVAGQSFIELHDRSGGNSVEIAVLTVNEP